MQTSPNWYENIKNVFPGVSAPGMDSNKPDWSGKFSGWISTKKRNEDLKEKASELMNHERNRQYQLKWYKGDKPTTAEYYSAIRKASYKDAAKANDIALGFIEWQNDPNNEYYEPYLYNMTNTAAADGIEKLLGIDISGGVTQKDINELKKYADYSNIGVGGAPVNGGTAAQRLAYWTYQLEMNEKTTQQAEKELEWMNQDIQTLVDKGFSDEYIVKYLNMSEYPTLKKMLENAQMGAVTPLNRAIGFSNDYVYGAIWAARNGGSTGKTTEDIANWHDKVGKSYVPDKNAEAARDPASDNYHPYSFGATLDFLDGTTLPKSGTYNRKWLEDNKDMLRDVDQAKEYRKIKTAVENTEQAQAELAELKENVLKLIDKGNTPDSIELNLTKNQFKNLEEKYPMLAKMEFARREGTYISLTDTVDFALPYFKKWMDEEYANRHSNMETRAEEAFENAKTYIDSNFGTGFTENGGGNQVDKTPEPTDRTVPGTRNVEEDKEDNVSAPVKPDAEANAPEENATHVQEEKPAEKPAETQIEETSVTEEVPVTPNPYFDIRQVLAGDDVTRVGLLEAIQSYRQGKPIEDENAAAFVEKYPYLFGGLQYDLTYRDGSADRGLTIDTRSQTKGTFGYKKNELGDTMAALLKRADTAQSDGYYSQWEYTELIMSIAAEVENAKESGKTLEKLANTEGTSANELLKTTERDLDFYYKAEKDRRFQEQLDYATRTQEMFNAYEKGTFYEMDFADEEEMQKWEHLLYEADNTVITKNDGAYYDPKGYASVYGNAGDEVKAALENYDQYNEMEYNGVYWPKESVDTIVTNRTNARLYRDYAIAKAAGVTLDAYYNAMGYYLPGDKDAAGKGLTDINQYVAEIAQREAESWARIDEAYSNDLYDAIQTLEVWEESEEDTNRFDFSEEEISGALEYGMITPEQADMLRVYNQSNAASAVSKSDGGYSLEEWEKQGGIDAIKASMYNYIGAVSQEENEKRVLGIKPGQRIGLVGNRTEGKASLGYVIGTSIKLGTKEFQKSWLETYYAFTRMDATELEKNYRTLYSREELRGYIEQGINDINDPELRNAMYEQFMMFDGDIYDFDFDVSAENIQNKVRSMQEKIDWLHEDIAKNCTQGQAEAIETMSSMVNSAETMAVNIAITAISSRIMPASVARFLGSILTTGALSAGETINALMDADVSGDVSKFAGLTTGILTSAVEVALDPLVGSGGKFDPANAGASKVFMKNTASKIAGEASEGFLKAASKRALNAAGNLVQSGMQEAAEGLMQDSVDTIVPNVVLDFENKEHLKKMWNWDEVWENMGDSFIQGILMDFGADVAKSPVTITKSAWEKRETKNAAASRLAMHERVSGEELKRAKEHLNQIMADGTLAERIAEKEKQAEIDLATIEKVANRKEELKSSPAQSKLQTARGKLEQAQADYDEARQKEEAAKQAVAVATAPFEQEGHNPTEEETNAYTDAMQELSSAKVTANMAQDDLKNAQTEFDEASAEAESEIVEAITQAADEARQEKVQEIKDSQVRQAQEEYAQAEERTRKAKEQTLKDIQESTGASDKEMKAVQEKAQKILNSIVKDEQSTKNEIAKDIEKKTGYKVRYDDTAGVEAGWVVRENGKREMVFNASMDANTIATAVAAHELVHVSEDSKFYDQFKKSVFTIAFPDDTDGSKKQAALESVKAEYAEDGIVLSDKQAERELVAELAEDLFRGKRAWVNWLLRDKPNVLVRIYDWVKDKVDYFKTLVKQGKDAAEAYKLFKKMQNTFYRALTDAGLLNTKGNNTEVSNANAASDEDEIFTEADAKKPSKLKFETEIPSFLRENRETDINEELEIEEEWEEDSEDYEEGDVRERALKRRIEAADRARMAAKLSTAAKAYRAAGDWKNYNRAIELLYSMGNTSVRPNKPHVIMKTLAEAFGIGVYEGKAPVGTTFEKYDNRASALKVDRNTELDVAFSMYAVGEKIKKMTGMGDPSSDYSMGDFLFEYMMNTDKQLSKVARNYLNDVFRPAVEKAGDGFMNALETARANLTTFKNASSAEKLSAYIVSKSDKKTEGIASKIRELKISLIDSTYAAEIVDMVTGSHDFRKAATYLPYAKRRADAVLTGDAFVDMDGNITGGDTLKTALRDIKKGEVDAFNSYLVAIEAVSRFDAGFPPFKDAFTIDDMRETVQMYESKYKHFKAAAERYDAWWDNFMQTYVVAEGFLTPEQYEKMREVHPHYVSFAREGTKKYRITYAKGNSDLPIIAPLESAIAMVNQFTKRAAQNRFAQTFDRLYQQNEDLGFIATELKRYIPEETTYDDDLNIYSAKTQDTYENAEIDENLKALSETVVYADDAKYGDVITVIRKDGTRVKYVLNDKATFDLISGYSYEIQNEALKTIGAITRFMTRATTGINPMFLVTNSVRDFQKSVNYGSWANTYGDGLAKWLYTFVPTLFDKGKDLKQYKALGGGGWSVIRLTSNKGKNSYKNALFRDDRKFRELSVPQKIGRVFQFPRRLVERVGDAVETTSRLVEYKYGKHDKTTQQGRIEAFMAAQEVTVDFERGGRKAQLLRTFIPFANATMQGYVQNIRMYTDAEKERIAPRIAKSLFNSALLGASSAIMNKMYLGEDDEKYTELTEEQKRGYILFPLFGGGEREFLRLPVAQDWLTKAFFEFGRQLGSGEYKDETLGGDILSLAIDMVAEPILGSTTIISPILDVGKNLSWSNTPIVKQSIQKYAPEARYDATTAEVFKWASRQLVGTFRDVIGISGNSPFLNHFTPEALEYLAQQYTGVYGQFLIPALSYNKYTGETDFFGNATEAIRNRFTLDADSYNQVTNAYYDNSDFVTEIINHARGMREYNVNASLTDSELSRMYGEIKNANSDGGILKKYEDQIQAHRDKIAQYEADNLLSDEVKADLVEAETERINQIMRDYNAWVGERKDILKGTLFNRKQRLLTANADVAVLSDTYRTAYENNEPYMLEAVRLKNNGTGKSVLPQVDYTFTYDKTNWEVKDEYREAFEKAFENAYAEEIRTEFDGNSDYESWEEDDKATFFSKLRGNAQATAKQEAIDNGWIEEKN